MVRQKQDKLLYILFLILSLSSIMLIFNNNLWFDEAYTVSLIHHSFPDIIRILKTDMHPPLYFVSLKLFCELFGYSVITTKIFSVLGYIATLSLGITVVKKHFKFYASAVYMLVLGAIPMSLYFSVQQRSYQWCIFFVALSFLEALLFLENQKYSHCFLFVAASLLASYNHIYSLLAVGIIFTFLNIFVFIKNRKLLKAVVISDLAMIIGYSPWILPLLYQAKSAKEDFWLTSAEPLSIVVFVVGIIILSIILSKKDNRKLPIIFAVIVVMGVQAVGLFVTIFIRPFYIARYSIVILGVFSLLLALGTENLKDKYKKIICTTLVILQVFLVAATGVFEYNPSMNNFLNHFKKISSKADTIVYCDSSFGMLSYYLPENTHICTYKKSWFEAFSNIECVDADELDKVVGLKDNLWFVKNTLTKTPEFITDNYKITFIDSFKCDFNMFELYLLE